MVETMRLLVFAPHTGDVERIERELAKNAISHTIRNTGSLAGFMGELEEFSPHIVLADGRMEAPGIREIAAILAAHSPLCLLFHLTPGETDPKAAGSVAGGVEDSLPMENLSRLVPALERAMDKRRILAENAALKRELALAGREWALLFDAINHPTIIMDAQQNILSANRAMAEATGVSAGEMTGRKCHELFHSGQKGGPDPDCPFKSAAATKRMRLGEVKGGEAGHDYAVTCTPLYDDDNRLARVIHIATDISERKQAQADRVRLSTAIEQASEGIVIVDTGGRLVFANRAMRRFLGDDGEKQLCRSLPQDPGAPEGDPLRQAICDAVRGKGAWRGKVCVRQEAERNLYLSGSAVPVLGGDGAPESHAMVFSDVTGKEEMEARLRLDQKLKSLGHLAAGVAHEINTPTQYVDNNLRFLEEELQDVWSLVDRLAAGSGVAKSPAGKARPNPAGTLAALWEEIGREGRKEEMEDALRDSLEGMAQIAGIVRSMQALSHPGGGEMVETDLNAAIGNAVTVSTNQWKYVADLETDLDPDLPQVPCMRGELNQVLLNLIVNAATAIGETGGETSGTKGCIRISTRTLADRVEIRVRDTGGGIPETVREHVFDPFFSTGDVGRGTGQGLAVCHSIVTGLHGGEIAIEDKENRGTTVIVRLPLSRAGRGEPGKPQGGPAI